MTHGSHVFIRILAKWELDFSKCWLLVGIGFFKMLAKWE